MQVFHDFVNISLGKKFSNNMKNYFSNGIRINKLIVKPLKIIVTGGSGFIGSALIRTLILSTDHTVVNIDKLTYAGNSDSLLEVAYFPRYTHKIFR